MTPSPTKYSILDLAVVSRGQTLPQTFANLLDLARQAEADGYERLWLAEHHNSVSVASSAPSILIGHVAAGTTTLRVGSGGVMLPNHSPIVVAEQFGTLGQLYPGRIDLGLGRAPGTDQATAHAIRSDFMQAAQSFPRDIEQIQRFFSPDNASSPVRATVAEGADVPIYILGSSTDSAHLAAAKGLPYAFASHFATAHLTEALRIYRQEFVASPALAAPYVMTGVNVVVADTDAAAQRLYTSLLQMFIGLVTGQRDYLQPPTEMTADLRQARAHPVLQQMLRYSFVGSKATVKRQIRAFLDDIDADELIVSTAMYAHADRLRSYALFGEIMAELNDERYAELAVEPFAAVP